MTKIADITLKLCMSEITAEKNDENTKTKKKKKKENEYTDTSNREGKKNVEMKGSMFKSQIRGSIKST